MQWRHRKTESCVGLARDLLISLQARQVQTVVLTSSLGGDSGSVG